MSAKLDRPDSVDTLYLYRGEEVVGFRPLMQGDVFANIEIPGLDDGDGHAIILTHACSMRRGTEWALRLLIARVTPREPIALDAWPGGFFREMPLPSLDPAQEDVHYSARFESCGSVRPDLLLAARRIACLDPRGITLLQQRYIFHLTRYEAPLSALYKVSEPTLIEAELLEDWLEAALQANAVLEDATRAFEDLIRAPRDGSTLQKDLEDPARQAAVRRAVTEARNSSYPAQA